MTSTRSLLIIAACGLFGRVASFHPFVWLIAAAYVAVKTAKNTPLALVTDGPNDKYITVR